MKNKKCPGCKCDKPLEEFYHKKTENRYSSWCKQCVYTCQKQRWTDRKKKAVKLMGGKCCKCGYDRNYAALDFHHLDPTDKDHDWGTLKLRPWSDVVKELKKCVLMCRNCHAEEHYPTCVIGDCLHDNKVLNKNFKPTGKCKSCGVEVYGTEFCSVQCVSFSRRKVERPTAKELELMLNERSWVSIARQFNVSDNAIRKWAKQYGLTKT